MSLIFSDFYSAEEFSNRKNVTLKTVYSWISKGIAPPFEMYRGTYLFHKNTADAFTPPKRGRKRS